jgi:hypothetical protein
MSIRVLQQLGNPFPDLFFAALLHDSFIISGAATG